VFSTAFHKFLDYFLFKGGCEQFFMKLTVFFRPKVGILKRINPKKTEKFADLPNLTLTM